MRITMCFVKSTFSSWCHVVSSFRIKTIMKCNLTFFSRNMNVPNYFTSYQFSIHNHENLFLWICSISSKYLMNTMIFVTKTIAFRIFHNISFCLSVIMHWKQSWISNFYSLFCLVQFYKVFPSIFHSLSVSLPCIQ